MKTKLFLPTLFLLVLLVGCSGRLMTPVYAPVPPGSTNPPVIVGYLPNTNATGALGTAQQIGGLLPSPANWIVEGLSALGLIGLGAYARIKTKLAADNGDKAAQAQDILNAAITAIEAVAKSNTAVKSVKESIASHVAAAGYGEEFHKQVQEVSNKL